ncbi:MAG: hypothetical protein WAW88_04170, partial [Nocardioides sp.]
MTNDSAQSLLMVEFCGEEHLVAPGTRFAVGREADLVVDDANSYLHRRIIEFFHENDFWWVANVGTRLSVTVSGEAGTMQSWLGPGSRIPVVLPTLALLFTAGGTTYELGVRCPVAPFVPLPVELADSTQS